jgi:hypothetical protein
VVSFDSAGDIRAQVFNADGTKSGSEVLVNTTTQDVQRFSAIAALNDGGFVVVFEDFSGIIHNQPDDNSGIAVRAQIFSSDGTKSGSEFLVNTTITASQSLPAIAGLADGGFVVAFRDESLGVQTSNDDTSQSAVRAQVYSADGTKSGSEFLVNTTTTNSQSEPVITALANGRFIVAFADTSSISAVRAQVFNADGTKSGSELLVNDTIWQSDPAITELADGHFVISFDTGGDIKAQVFNADGTKSGSVFLVNTTTAEDQYESAITALADGRFVVAFTDRSAWSQTNSDDNSSYAVRAQVFNADGTKSGSEFLVNTTTTNAQDKPVISALADGRFVVVFAGNGTGDTSGVFAQIFDPRLAAINLSGSALDDDFVGSVFGDTVGGGLGKDNLAGAAGNDTLTGGAEDDTIDGGADTDKAVYSGNRQDYTITESAGIYTVVDDRTGSPDGTDTVTNVENFQFADRTVGIVDILNAAPTDITLSSDSVNEKVARGGNIGAPFNPAGTMVAALAAVDADNNETAGYAIISDPSGLFEIGGVNGDEIRVKAGVTVDYESATTHNVEVEVTDKVGNTFKKTITINVNDYEGTGTGTSGADTINGTSEEDEITGNGGPDTFTGSLAEFYRDTFTDFSEDDKFIFDGVVINRDAIEVTTGSAILAIDETGDGNPEGQFTLQGDFTGGDFMAVASGSDTLLTFETFLPQLTEGQAINPSLVNGINNQEFLTGDGSTDFKVTLRDLGFAGYDNVVGVYEIDAGGNLVDTRMLFKNANTNKSAQATISDVEAGNRLGFFIVQDAADVAEALSNTDTFSFVNSSGAAANLSDGSDTFLAVNGSAVNETVFHSFARTMNTDGVQHTLSGVNVGGESITVGFEDLTGGGDRDYEDVVFMVETFDSPI